MSNAWAISGEEATLKTMNLPSFLANSFLVYGFMSSMGKRMVVLPMILRIFMANFVSFFVTDDILTQHCSLKLWCDANAWGCVGQVGNKMLSKDTGDIIDQMQNRSVQYWVSWFETLQQLDHNNVWSRMLINDSTSTNILHVLHIAIGCYKWPQCSCQKHSIFLNGRFNQISISVNIGQEKRNHIETINAYGLAIPTANTQTLWTAFFSISI